MPKFDYIIQNPPYSKSLHLDFLKAGYNMLSDTGKMIIIEPSTFYINISKNGKAKKYDEIKKLIKDHVYKVTIENYNKEFGTTNTTPFSITYIDNSKIYKNIEYINCGYKQYVNSLYDCNNIGLYKLIWSILDKLSCDKIKNHKTNKQSNNKNIYYCQLTDYVWGQCGLYIQRPSFCNSDSSYFKHKLGSFFQSFVAPSMHITRNELTNIIPCKAARGGSSKGKVKLTNIPATCLYGTKNEIKNYKYFISNNSLPIFINMVMSIDMANNSLDYVPWLVDNKYTDQEIYDKFGFTEEEIKLIETTIKKYERYSPWFKRYMCGPSSVSDEEVQKYIDELNA